MTKHTMLRSNRYFFISVMLYLFIRISSLSSVEVGGYLTENTTWSPENNPYLITEHLTIPEGITLTILPGVEIRPDSAPCSTWYEFDANFWLMSNPETSAKSIFVEGSLLAIGTPADSIIFTHQNDESYDCWGNIVVGWWGGTGFCQFEHCRFEYSAGLGLVVGAVAHGTLSLYTRNCRIRNCNFYNNFMSISCRHCPTGSLEVTGCIFSNSEDFIEQAFLNLYGIVITNYVASEEKVLIAGNTFIDRDVYVESVYYTGNMNISSLAHVSNQNGESFFFGNEFSGRYSGLEFDQNGSEHSLYIKNNQFKDICDIELEESYINMSDNYFEDSYIHMNFFCTGSIYNNTFVRCPSLEIGGDFQIFNNIFSESVAEGVSLYQRSYDCQNSIIANNRYAVNTTYTPTNFKNSIIINNQDLTHHSPISPITFQNCIIDFPLEYPLIDRGGNIRVDSLRIQSLFEDISEGDYHLTATSLAIDSGIEDFRIFPFDLDNRNRRWDGDNDGIPRIDIGVYEYSSPLSGGIYGRTLLSESQEPLDYVFLMIEDHPELFTFSDGEGEYELKLPAGRYNLYAERYFYGEVRVDDLEVTEGEFTLINIHFSDVITADDNFTLPPVSQIVSLTNYPNPFNPTTSIEFELTEAAEIIIIVYNNKGQRVKKLTESYYSSGIHTVTWDGKDNHRQPVASGIYFYKILADNSELVKKMLLLK